MALTREKIVDELVSRYGLQRREAVDFLDTFLDDIKRRVSDGERASLVGFGVLYLHGIGHRKRRNIPVTDDIPDWRIPTIKISGILKKRVQRAVVEESRDVD